MDSLGTPKEILLETPRTTTPGTPNIYGSTSSTTPRDINILSPGINSSSSLSRSTNSVTPERINLQTKIVTDIRKVTKSDK